MWEVAVMSCRDKCLVPLCARFLPRHGVEVQAARGQGIALYVHAELFQARRQKKITAGVFNAGVVHVLGCVRASIAMAKNIAPVATCCALEGIDWKNLSCAVCCGPCVYGSSLAKTLNASESEDIFRTRLLNAALCAGRCWWAICSRAWWGCSCASGATLPTETVSLCLWRT